MPEADDRTPDQQQQHEGSPIISPVARVPQGKALIKIVLEVVLISAGVFLGFAYYDPRWLRAYDNVVPQIGHALGASSEKTSPR
jgi:hypothetical protein